MGPATKKEDLERPLARIQSFLKEKGFEVFNGKRESIPPDDVRAVRQWDRVWVWIDTEPTGIEELPELHCIVIDFDLLLSHPRIEAIEETLKETFEVWHQLDKDDSEENCHALAISGYLGGVEAEQKAYVLVEKHEFKNVFDVQTPVAVVTSLEEMTIEEIAALTGGRVCKNCDETGRGAIVFDRSLFTHNKEFDVFEYHKGEFALAMMPDGKAVTIFVHTVPYIHIDPRIK